MAMPRQRGSESGNPAAISILIEIGPVTRTDILGARARPVSMIKLLPPFRLATKDDAAVLAELVNAAGEGLPEYLWSKMAEAGQVDPWEIGRKRQADAAQAGKVIVLEFEGRPVASLTGYAIAAEPAPVPDNMPALFRPLQELENLAPATWYVNVLAALPGHRGKGFGSRLLALAEDIASDCGLSGLSIIVADNNSRARKLYERSGYVELARRPMIREGWLTPGRQWILLTKTL
jgi:ribosomal protein S18 acetylase RimI-like enzyme